jgi:biotin carboxylase
MKKKILVVGGGEWQVPLIQRLKSFGHIVINTNLYADSPGFAFSEYSYVVDVLDKETNLQIAKKHKVDAVLTDQSDIAVNTVAYVNEKLGLAGVTTEIAELFTNKYRMRKEFKIKGLKHPRYKLCNSLRDLEDFLQELQVPLIIKPTNNQSSRGVMKISTPQEITQAYKHTMQFCKEKSFLAEEYIGGIELTVEGFKYPNAEHHTFGVSQKTYFVDTVGVASTLLYLQTFDTFNIAKLHKINNKLFSQVPFAITHVEYKYYNGDFYLIEAAIRGGGTKISSHIVPALSSYDINELLIKSALKEHVVYEKKTPKTKAIMLKFFDFGDGEVKKIDYSLQSFEEYIIDFRLEFVAGETLHKPSDDRSRVGYVILQANSEEELQSVMKSIEENIKVEFI